MILPKYIVFMLLLYSNSVLSKIAGTWHAQSDNERHVLLLKIKKVNNNKIQISYSFIFDSGRKINEYTDNDPPLYLNRKKNGCYEGLVIDDFTRRINGGRAKVSLCEKGDGLQWSLLDDGSTWYLPRQELFLRDNEAPLKNGKGDT